jgi:hypothetical protein
VLNKVKGCLRQELSLTVRETVIQFTDDAGNRFEARGKWYEFYRLLVLRAGAPVDRHALCQLKSWKSDGLANGRDVARHLQAQKVQRLRHPTVSSAAVTQDWRLPNGWQIAYDGVDGQAPPDIFKIQDAAYGSVIVGDDIDVVAWGLQCLDAILCFYGGNVPRAFASAEHALALAGNDDLRSLTLFLCLRLGPRLEHSDQLLDRLEVFAEQLASAPASVLTDYARNRLFLHHALQVPQHEWPDLAQRLESMLLAPSPAFDPITFGYALNYAAVTQRRLGDLDAAARRIERALVHAIAGGELFMLQAAFSISA